MLFLCKIATVDKRLWKEKNKILLSTFLCLLNRCIDKVLAFSRLFFMTSREEESVVCLAGLQRGGCCVTVFPLVTSSPHRTQKQSNFSLPFNVLNIVLYFHPAFQMLLVFVNAALSISDLMLSCTVSTKPVSG